MASSPEPAAGSNRLASIDQMRGIAALYVAVYHALLVQWPNEGPRPAWYLRWADYGHVAVAVFIVLSGYSLALGIARRNSQSAGPYGRFMAKRAFRLLPPYWVALFGSIVLLALAPHDSRPAAAVAGTWSKGPVPFRSIPVFGLLLQDVFRVPSPNSPLWSIAVEWHLYFVFPVLIFLGCRYGMGRLVAAGLVIGVGLHVAVVNTSFAATTPHFLALFCFGIASAFAVARRTAAGRPGPPGGTRLGWTSMALAFLAFVLFNQWEVIGDVFAGAFVAYGLYVLGTTASPAAASPKRDRLRWLTGVGLISYSLYLIHSPTEKIVWQLFVSKLGLSPVPAFIVLAITGIAASLVAARILYVIVEQPSQRRAQRVGAPPPKIAPSSSSEPAPTWTRGRGAGRGRPRPAPPLTPGDGPPSAAWPGGVP